MLSLEEQITETSQLNKLLIFKKNKKKEKKL